MRADPSPLRTAERQGRGARAKPIRAVVSDLDGTIFEGERLADGALDLVRFLGGNGIRVFYCTNNSTKTRRQLQEKLSRAGLPTDIDAIYSAAYAAGRYAAEKSIRRAYCLGTDGLRHELRACGVKVTGNASGAPAAILGLDPHIDYRKIAGLTRFIGRRVPLVACNRDKFFPIEGGRLMPGCGFFVAAIEDLLDREVDHVVGKPGTYMLDLLSKEHGLASEELLVVGDSYASDVEMARRFGCRSVLVRREPGLPIPGVAVVRDMAEARDVFR